MKPFGLAKPLLSSNRGVLRIVATTAAAAGVGTLAWRSAHGEPVRRLESGSAPVKLPATAVDALAGAIGEVAQILVLYPLDTVKVRCQASGETAVVVVRRLLRRGFNLQLLQKLYAGALGAAACAVVVGAVHFASYEGSRKAFLKLLAPNGKPGSSMSSSTSSGGGSSCCVDGGVAGSAAGDTTYLHNATCAAAGLGAEPGASSNHALAGDPNATHGSPAWRRTAATFAAAFFAAVATALVESPVELFRHNAQAGLVQPNFLREMVSTVRREGVGGLYWGFLPHCFEAWPHDMAELATYGTMREYQDSVQRQYGSRRHGQGQGPGGAAAGGERAEGCAAGGEGAAPLLAGLSPEVWDLATGAASGAAAVLVSMPFDTVKTYLQTHGADLSGRGLLGSAALFVKSGRRIVSRKGLAGLYVGVTPRLLQQVPSAMVCWWAIAAFKRFMEPHTLPDDLEGPVGHGGVADGGHHHAGMHG